MEREECIKEGRGVGNTTRLIDYYVQELFNNSGKWVSIVDHTPSLRNDMELAYRITKRIADEHRISVQTHVEHGITYLRINGNDIVDSFKTS